MKESRHLGLVPPQIPSQHSLVSGPLTTGLNSSASVCLCLHPLQSCHGCLMNFKDVAILAHRKAVLDSSGLGLKCADYKAYNVSSAHSFPSLFFLSDCGFTSGK